MCYIYTYTAVAVAFVVVFAVVVVVVAVTVAVAVVVVVADNDDMMISNHAYECTHFDICIREEAILLSFSVQWILLNGCLLQRPLTAESSPSPLAPWSPDSGEKVHGNAS